MNRRIFSLGPFTALDLPIGSFIKAAAEHRLDAVSLIVCPPNPQLMSRCVTNENIQSIITSLDQYQISVLNAECLMLTPKTRIEDCYPAIEIAHQLGAKSITALLFDVDEARVVLHLQRLADRAERYDLKVNIEFLAMAPRWNSLVGLNQLLDKVNHPNIKICIDALHFIRSGGDISEIINIPAERIAVLQICDGDHLNITADYAYEAGENRVIPGEGVFPLEEIIGALPKNLPVEIEVPLVSSLSVADRLSKVVSATRNFL